MKLSLLVLDETLAICSLKRDSPLPDWATSSDFYSITRTYDELSIVCPQDKVPAGVDINKNWRCLKVQGPLGFSITGILASLSMPLASEGVSIFVFSSYDTDHIMVKQYELDKAVEVLQKAGHTVQYQK
ncbi:MAG: hypothetical protein A4E28_01498 [Methanocella sp. PtaU1.Bin125]|nr:MAG: hypothetical protein A4E28_01498 [Methanocella sp. PtaU1.Bin125]